MRFLELLAATFFAAWASVTLQRAFGIPEWGTYAIALAMTVLLHLIAIPLTTRYSHTDTPLLDAARGEQKTLPFWLRLLGVLAIGFALSIPFQLFATWLRS